MKNLKKVLALLLVAVMAIGMFAACTPAVQDPTTTQKPADNTTAGDKDPTDGTTVKTLEPKTIKCMVAATCYDNFPFQRFVDGETNIYPWFQKALAEKNLTIEWTIIEEDQYDTALQTTLADPDNMPDYIWLGSDKEALAIEAAASGVLKDIQSILAESDGTASGWHEANPAYFSRSEFEGKNWWIGEYQKVTWQGEEVGLGMGAPTALQIREDWLNALTEKGYDYGSVDKWPNTLEELGAYIQACQDEDLNGNGLPDESLFAYFDQPARNNGINKVFGVPHNEFSPNLATGKLDTFWESKNVKEYIKTLIEFNEKGWIADANWAKKASSTTALSTNTVAAFDTYYNNSWSLKAEYVPEGAETPKFSGLIFDNTVYPDNYIGHDAAPTMDNRMACFSANADAEACARLLDILYSAEWLTMIEYGTEGDSYFVNNAGEKVMVQSEDSQSATVSTNACTGRGVFSFNVFPQMGNVYPLENDAEYAAGISDNALTQFSATMEVPCVYPNQITGYLAVTTPEEAEIIAELETDYQTTSAELFVKLLLGELDVDADWDSIMAELEAAGYSQLKAVYTARYERYVASQNG